MHSTFDDRIKLAREFEEELFEKIEQKGFAVAVNGTEHTHPKFVERLHRSNDQTSLAIRFQPDGVASIGKIPRSFYVEAKCAKNIEKTAYEQYMKLYRAGNIVILVFKKLDWSWCFVEELPMEPAEVTVAPFPPKRRFPIVDGWLTPRATGRKPRKGSGTPYRKVIGSQLRKWSTFKRDVLYRLASINMDN